MHGQYFWDLFPAFLLSGIGLALAFVPMSIGALTGVEQSDAGVASGLINTSQQIGGAIGVAAATTIATTFSTHYVHAHPGVSALSGGALTHGFQITFYVLAGDRSGRCGARGDADGVAGGHGRDRAADRGRDRARSCLIAEVRGVREEPRVHGAPLLCKERLFSAPRDVSNDTGPTFPHRQLDACASSRRETT